MNRVHLPSRQRFAPRRNTGFDWGLFLNESIRSFSTTASVVPSSPYLARALLRSIDFSRALSIVEVGVGTGAVTHELLRRMRPDARLYAIDINPRFIAYLRSAIDDRRLIPIAGSAEDLGSILAARGVLQADAIVSSLGLSIMPKPLRERILREMKQHLRPGGVFSQFQYLHARHAPRCLNFFGVDAFCEERFLRQNFRRVSLHTVFRNFLPATVYTCWSR
jgi:phosphatidylethanolamine/phosphatidyl-N-methylethanolamine N-methyltransferase